MIREEMRQTRTALTEKLEALECQVLGTVQGATSAVQETVTTVKDAVQDTVARVKGTIDDTLCTVKGTVDETVGSVKENLDVELQVRRHPLAVLAGAVAAGYVSGMAMQQLTQRAPAPHYLPSSAVTPPAPTWNDRRDEAPMPARSQGLAETVLSSLEPEIAKVKALAIGAVFNLVKGMARQYVPQTMQPQVGELVDSVTTKLGGKPLHGSIMEEYQAAMR